MATGYYYNPKTSRKRTPKKIEPPNPRPKGQPPPWFDYYNPVKLLSMRDMDGDRPAIYISSGNRTGGKTTAFNGYLVNRYIKHKEKFGLIYRYAKDSKDVVDRFFKDIQQMWFKDYEMRCDLQPYGCEIILDGQICGFGLALNLADDIKKRSHLLSEVRRCLFDEFQSESGDYLDNEVTRLQTIMFSLSRGGGKMYRYVPCYLVSNQVSVLNPYYNAMGILDRLVDGANYIKGHGWVMEIYINPSSQKAIKLSPLAKAFSKSAYMTYASDGGYLNDNTEFIQRIKSKDKKYRYTLKYNGELYGVHKINDILYVSAKADSTRKSKYACTDNDVTSEYPLRPPEMAQYIKTMCNRGAVRYQNIKCKEAIKELKI